jgi:ribonuclease-3
VAKEKTFAQRIGHKFKDPKLLTRALTHSSFKKEGHNYEALEFLGDRVLDLVVAEELYRRDPNMSEGRLTQSLKSLVCTETLAQVARELGLPEALRTEKRSTHTVRASNNVLADSCEALIAAIYLDGGIEPARQFVQKHWGERFANLRSDQKDAKSTLQEWADARLLAPPNYRVVNRSGPQHEPLFVVEVAVKDRAAAIGEGKSKRQAEQEAARALLVREGVWVE